MALRASLDCTSASVSSCRHLRNAAHVVCGLAVSTRHSHSRSRSRSRSRSQLSQRCSHRCIVSSALALPECQAPGSKPSMQHCPPAECSFWCHGGTHICPVALPPRTDGPLRYLAAGLVRESKRRAATGLCMRAYQAHSAIGAPMTGQPCWSPRRLQGRQRRSPE